MQESTRTRAMTERYHTHQTLSNQCSSHLVQTIEAPLPVVWSIVRDFTKPQAYKQFIKSCTLRSGGGDVGSIREVMVVSGMPAGTSMEKLECLDDESHVMSFSIIGGDHRLVNYKSTTTLHEEEEDKGHKTVVIESYIVDVPTGSTEEDTCSFANTIVGCNLRSLARISEKMASKN